MEIEVNHIAGLIAPGGSLQGRRHIHLVPQCLRNLDRVKKFKDQSENLPPNCLRCGGCSNGAVLILHGVEDLVQVVHVSVSHQCP